MDEQQPSRQDEPGATPSPNDVALAPGVHVSRARLVFTFSRSRGPGGQSVNKVSTAVQLRVAVTAIEGLGEAAADRLRRIAGSKLTGEDEILIHADETRSQSRNREAAVERLRELVLRAQHVPKVRRKRKPSRAMKERRLRAKRELSEKKGRRKRLDP